MITKEFLNSCSNELILLSEKIVKTEVGGDFTVELSPSDFINEYPKDKLKDLVLWAKELPKSKFIYAFFVNGGLPTNELFRLFQLAKDNEHDAKGTRAYSRLIHESSVLYVGSSRSLESRIGQHLGHKSKAVYSMHLKHWIKIDSIETLQIRVWRFSEHTDQQVLQSIEDYLWKSLQPMLGKQGGK
jgi:hypothetical protein